jgi:hypothetical protein
MWIFNSKKYINHLWVVWGFTHCSWFTPFILFSLSIHFSPIHYSSFILILAWEGKMNCWRWAIVLLAVMIAGVFQPWINACMSEMHWHMLSCAHSCESWESQHGDSWPNALEPWKEVDNLRYCVPKKGVHSLGLCMLDKRELVYLDCCVCWEACENLSVDWFGKLSDTLEPSLWIHSPGSGVTLLLRLGTTMSKVGWEHP